MRIPPEKAIRNWEIQRNRTEERKADHEKNMENKEWEKEILLREEKAEDGMVSDPFDRRYAAAVWMPG